MPFNDMSYRLLDLTDLAKAVELTVLVLESMFPQWDRSGVKQPSVVL